MKIEVRRIPEEGIALEEQILPEALELETGWVSLQAPVRARGFAYRVSNTLIVDLEISGSLSSSCGRCLEEFNTGFKKALKLTYEVDSLIQVIELTTDIREEILLDFPIKPLCRQDCKGLCPACGKNINEGPCACNA